MCNLPWDFIASSAESAVLGTAGLRAVCMRSFHAAHQCYHLNSLKSAKVGVHTPGESAKDTNQAFSFIPTATSATP